jgi:hypothetical protein
MTDCPSAATLARLGTNSLCEDTFSSLEGHIEQCPECQARLERLRCNDAALPSTELDLPLLPNETPEIPGFAIERELGRGGMGVVYLARQPSLRRQVALKVVRSGPTAGSREYARWLREGRSFSLLRHENVVRLYDVGEAGGWLYLVLEYIPGGTLSDRLDAPYAARDAARWLAAIADAVEAIHRAGLLHLDLKPSNILMDAAPGAPREQAIPRVGDFGLAYLRDDPDATANAIGPLGTPRYMAPEQIGADRARLGPTADVYGLGALLYHVVTGRPPFAAPSVAETLEQVRSQEPVPPRRLNPAIPRDLETICLKCLRKDPGQRYGSAQEVADDLRRFLDGAAIVARPVSPLERTWRWSRRRPAVAALAAALVLTLGAGFLGMFFLWRHAESQRERAERERARAEAAQARAAADFARATELLDQLVTLNVGGTGNVPKFVSPQETIALLQFTRRSLIDLAERMPNREGMLRRLRAVNVRLSQVLSQEQRWDELRSLYESSLREAEDAIQQFPHAAFPRQWQIDQLSELAGLAEREGKSEEVAALCTRAVICAETWFHDTPGNEPLIISIKSRRGLARVVSSQGRAAEARALLLVNHRLIQDFAPQSADEYGVAEVAIDPVYSHHLGFDPPMGPPVEGDGPANVVAMLGSPEADRFSADVWARLAARALRFDDRDRPATFRECVAAQRFAWWLYVIASEERRGDCLDQARRTADRMVALAGLLVQRHPDNPAAHLLLADAYEQVKKNAWEQYKKNGWQVKDRNAVEQNSRLAIAENRRAVDLAPYDEVAHHELEHRLRKLEDLHHPK